MIILARTMLSGLLCLSVEGDSYNVSLLFKKKFTFKICSFNNRENSFT